MAAWTMRLLTCTQRVCKQPVALDPVTDLLPASTPFWPFSHQWIAWQLHTQQWIQSGCY
jgi:hypothetical protein